MYAGAPPVDSEKFKTYSDRVYNLSQADGTEQCNTNDGYLQVCDNVTKRACRLCQTCKKGYGASQLQFGECHECAETSTAGQLQIALVVFASFLVIALLIFLRLKSATGGRHVKNRAIHSTLKRILLTHLQVVVMVAALHVPWPREFMDMVAVFSSMSTVSQHMSSLSCEMGRGEDPIRRESGLLYRQTIILICLPPFTVIFLFFYWVVVSPHSKCLKCGHALRPSPICDMNQCVAKRRAKIQRKRAERTAQASMRSGQDASQRTYDEDNNAGNNAGNNSAANGGGIKTREELDGDVLDGDVIVAEESSSADDDLNKLMSTRDTWVYSITLLAYIMYPTLVRFPFELLQCRDIDGVQYLERDLEEQCFLQGSRHLVMLIMIAIPSLLLYAVGMPLGSILVLWSRRERLHTDKFRFRLGLLYSGYRENRWWWEVVVAARKVVIISFASFGFNEKLQVHIVLGFMLILLVCHFNYLPYDIHTEEGLLLHRVERNSLLSLICMLWAGVVFNMGEESKCESSMCVVVHNILVVFVVLVNVVLLTYGTYLFFYFFCKRNRVLEKFTRNSVVQKVRARASVASLSLSNTIRSMRSHEQVAVIDRINPIMSAPSTTTSGIEMVAGVNDGRVGGGGGGGGGGRVRRLSSRELMQRECVNPAHNQEDDNVETNASSSDHAVDEAVTITVKEDGDESQNSGKKNWNLLKNSVTASNSSSNSFKGRNNGRRRRVSQLQKMKNLSPTDDTDSGDASTNGSK